MAGSSYVLADNTQWETKGVRPFSRAEGQQAVSISSGARRGRRSVEIYRCAATSPFFPRCHDGLHFVVRLCLDVTHDLLEDPYPIPQLA